jgi:putative ABC transport system ATP-binding protein
MSALHLDGVTKTYRSGSEEIVALDDATLTVGDDEMLAIVGPSGSGKSTLISIAGGLLTPTSGSVVVGDDDITGYDARRLTRFRAENVGFVFQTVNLVPFLTALENLLVVGEFASRGRATRRQARERADQLLEELGMTKRRGNLPAQLSGGERQRVAVARALMNEPKLVLFDEPTSALDSHLGEQVMHLIHEEVKGRGTAAVLVTHDTRVTHHCDRIVSIADGRLAEEAPAEVSR